MATYNVAAPDGYHWMQYDDGPVLMVGPADHEGAAETMAFEVIETHPVKQGAAWDKIYNAILNSTGDKRLAAATATARVGKSYEPAPVEKRRLMFVVSSPSGLDVVRKKHLCGRDGALFNEHYLGPLEMSRDEVDVIDLGELQDHRDANPLAVIALGKAARIALGSLADVSLPHPVGVKKAGGSREMLTRKLAQVKKLIEKGGQPKHSVKVYKADEAKRIVYGVVLDPYIVDAHDDHLSPASIEETAHDWMVSSRQIGVDHNGTIDAQVVESWLHPYPSAEDYKAAIAGEPHKARRTTYGDDVVHSGSWILGVKLNPDQWSKVKSGELNAFSIGGFGTREAMDESEMPVVEFIDD